MPVTFGQARDILSPFVGVTGRCPSAEETALFVKKVLQYMLYSGANGDKRKFNFIAVRGCITVPQDLETPLKVKIGDHVGTVYDKWFEFHPYTEEPGCFPCQNALFEDPNPYPTVYDVEAPFTRVATQGIVEEASDAHMIVAGLDLTGREVVTQHKGEEIIGEYLSIKKGIKTISNVNFSVITSITKTRTKGYVSLYGVDPTSGAKKFLSDYTPYTELPQYRRFRLAATCPDYTRVSIYGRIRLKDYYSDNDILPFENLYAIELAGQAVQSSRNDDPQSAAAKDTLMVGMLNRENSSKQINNGQPVEMYHPLSMGSIGNIVGRRSGW